MSLVRVRIRAHYLRASLLLTLPLAACFDSNDPEAESAGTETSTDGDGDGDPTGDGDGDGDDDSTGDGDGDPAGDGDGDPTGDGDGDPGPDTTPPTIEAFTVDGSATPSKLLQSKVVRIEVDATDDVGVTEVEIFESGNSLGTASAELLTPTLYTLDVVISGQAANGDYLYTAVARDAAGNEAEAGPIDLEVEVPPAGTLVWDATITPSASNDYLRDCMITADNRLVIAGTSNTQGVVTFFDAATGSELDEWTYTGPMQAWYADNVEPGPNGEGTVVGLRELNDDFLEVRRYNADGDELWTSGPLDMGGSFGPSMNAMTVTNDLVFLSSDRFNGTSKLIALDVQSGSLICQESLFGTSSVGELIVLDNQDVVAVGTSGVASPTIGVVARYTDDCSEVWSSETPASGYSGAWATDQGTILAAGQAGVDQPEGPFNGLLRELALDGTQGQPSLFDRTEGRDIWSAVARTPAGDIVLAGETGIDDNLFGGDFFVRAENPPGNLVWEIDPINGDADNYDTATAVCLDGAGNTFVGGTLTTLDNERDWYIARYAP